MKNAPQNRFVHVLAIVLLVSASSQMNCSFNERGSSTGSNFLGATWTPQHLRILSSLVLALLGSGIFSFKQHRDIKKQSEDIKTKNTQLKAANKKLKVAQENMKQQIAAAKEHYKNKEVPQFVQVIEQVFETLVNDLVGFDLFKETDTKQKKTKNKGSAPLSTPLKNKKPKKNIEITDQVDTQEKVDITKNHNPFLVDGDQANPGLKEIKV